MNSMSNEKGGDLVVMQQPLQPLVVFGQGGVDDILSKLKAEVRAIPTDISTAAGRKQIASLAYKVARSKTALDDLGKDLVSEWKEKAKKVDEDRRRIREELDALKDEVRKPLTDWEEAEEARVSGHEAALKEMQSFAIFDSPEPDIGLIGARLVAATEYGRDWQEFSARAANVRLEAIESLRSLLSRRQAQEAERAELARLKAEEEARRQREHEERIAKEAAERARKEAEEAAAKAAREAAEKAEAERRRVEEEAAAKLKAEQAERERAEKQRQEAEARAAKAEADAKAAAEKAEQDRIQAERLAQQRAVEAAERAERDRQKAIEDERARVAAAKAAEEEAAAKRERDKKHKAKINNEALVELISTISGVHTGDRDEAEAICKAVIAAIARGDIPHITISY